MEIKLLWAECKIFGDKKVDAYWVEASETEMMSIIYPLLISEEKNLFDELKKQYKAKENSEITKAGHFYFLITKDTLSIKPESWSFPYSGMWNAYNPFKTIEPKTISSLDEILKYQPIIND